ncbi:hypothetical protein [Ralstonia flaminis]|jgi:hypothetical protein|uniref:Uncharacterized protein n=1 Tax=Ralstonia flaminis TaxID=3058597 RepID=A0ABN9JLC7_9RALS|nr:hypothetical protein [Ralstonia sp. LMG 18101]CAJ0813396.1 hypothetical protein LMG18101_01890 [Ralstonia sp. LMG 18101]
MRLKAIALMCCVALGTLPSLTAAQVETKCESRYRIYFGNGIRNTPQDWEASKDELAAMIGARFNGVPVSYANAINPTGDLLMTFSACSSKSWLKTLISRGSYLFARRWG